MMRPMTMSEHDIDDIDGNRAPPETNDEGPEASDPTWEGLDQDKVIDLVESTGRISDLRAMPLNSYENRVWQVGIEDADPIVVKIYRPNRWSDEQLIEEHSFSRQLADADVPVVAPLYNEAGDSLLRYQRFQFTCYPRRGGYAPALDDMDNLYQLGQILGRIHAVGAAQPYQHRPTLNVESFGHQSAEYLLQHWIPSELRPAFETLSRDLLEQCDAIWQRVSPKLLRVHGDCHAGNILSRDGDIHFVDLDDSRMAPAVQDLWMFLSGDRNAQGAALAELVEGYNEFYDFHPGELPLIEVLRSLRILHHSAWLGRRWQDPAFPRAFPWFGNENYWARHILELREQLANLQEEPLKLF